MRQEPKKMNTICQHPLKTLQQNRELLVSEFLKGRTTDFLDQNALVLDHYFHESYERSAAGLKIGITGNPYAVVALGGYGRGEQCIHSDVDILLLFEKKVPAQAEDLIVDIIYPLWDLGLDVGHATRSVEECAEIAERDIEVLTSLLDARFVCGMSLLYSKLMERLRKKLILKYPEKFISLLVERNQKRHEHFGDSAYLLEPNLKEGQGGLRDYHTILWIARIKADIKQPRDLEYYGCFSHEEFSSLTKALGFIWSVRNRLHHLAGRKCDQLHFEHQIKLADALNFKKDNGQQPVEIFLGELHGQMEFIKQQYLMFLHEPENTGTQKGRKKTGGQTRTEGLEIKRGMLCFASPEAILNTPELLIKIFKESARLKLPLSAESKRLVRDFLHIVDRDFRTSASVVRTFERILVTPLSQFNVLNEMLNTGFLVRFIPEFGGIVNRIQYDEYHVYPVDKHLLRTVRTIKNFGTPEDPVTNPLCGEIYNELTDKKLLLWAALLHDIGKGEAGDGHSEKGEKIVRGILEEKGYSSREIETVAFLVREHLLLIKTATRRDTNDEETALFCAKKIKSPEDLKMLYLLTVADCISTGPKAWNEWTEILLTGFFLKILNILEKGELASSEAIVLIENKKREVLNSAAIPEQESEQLLNVMSPRYLLYTSASEIRDHIRLCKKMGNAAFIWDIAKSPDTNTRTVTVCAKDAPGLFSKIAGIFTLNNIDILNARVYTWRNNIALDIFNVMPPPDQLFEKEKWDRAEGHLHAALSGKLNIADAIREKDAAYGPPKPHISDKPPRIEVDNTSSAFFTIIEVFTYDFPGLLFRITDALFKFRLDVWFSNIATKADQVVDVFYVRDFDGQKADSPDQVGAIRANLRKILGKS